MPPGFPAKCNEQIVGVGMFGEFVVAVCPESGEDLLRHRAALPLPLLVVLPLPLRRKPVFGDHATILGGSVNRPRSPGCLNATFQSFAATLSNHIWTDLMMIWFWLALGCILVCSSWMDRMIYIQRNSIKTKLKKWKWYKQARKYSSSFYIIWHAVNTIWNSSYFNFMYGLKIVGFLNVEP